MAAINKRAVIVNSSILFVIASVWEMTLHEFGHFFASILLGAREISIHHNYVSNVTDGLPELSIIFIKAAGPIVSLAIGLAFHFVCSRMRERSLLFLFLLYFSAFGYIGFFGYLMIAPFFVQGDTGYICYALGFPGWLTAALALAGAGVLFIIMNRLMRYFVEMGTKEMMEDRKARRDFIPNLIMYPLIIGIVITTLLNLPVPVYISLIAAVFSPFSILWGYGSALNKNFPSDYANREFCKLDKINYWLFAFLALTALINRSLVYGIYF